jgi:hypothetical protein
MAAFLLRLPADMIDHIISQDFKDCTIMAESADKLYARRRGNAVTDSPVNAVSGGRCRESSPLAVPPEAQPPEDPRAVQR